MLKSADIPSLKKDFGVNRDQDSLLGVALDVLETGGRKDPANQCKAEDQDDAASCGVEKADLSAKPKVPAQAAPAQKLEYTEDDLVRGQIR